MNFIRNNMIYQIVYIFIASSWFCNSINLGDDPAFKGGSVAQKKDELRAAEDKLKLLRSERADLQRLYDISVDKTNLKEVADHLTAIHERDELIGVHETVVAAKRVDLMKVEVKEISDKLGTLSAELASTRDRQKATHLEYLEKSVLVRSIRRQIEKREPIDGQEFSREDRIEEERFRRDEDAQMAKLAEDLKRCRATIDRYDQQVASMQDEVVAAKIEIYDRLRQIVILENRKKTWKEVKSILDIKIKESKVLELY